MTRAEAVQLNSTSHASLKMNSQSPPHISPAVASTLYVDPGGTCGGNSPCFTTIQAAVNAASPGDVISVGPGTYPELVTVNKQLILRGAKAGIAATTCRTGAATGESVVTGNSGTTSFYVTANDVTIDGFVVQDQTSANQFGAGIVLNAGTSGAHIFNNVIQNNVVGLSLSNFSTTDRALIQYNLFQNNNQAGSASGTGIYTDQFNSGGNLTNVLIDSNKFVGNDDAGIDFSSTNPNSQSDIVISNNEFASNFRAMLMFYLSSSEITGNNIHDSNGASSADIRIFDGNNGLTITCNNLSNGAGRAIRVSRIVASDNSSTISANYNNISGYATAGLVVDSASYTGSFNAENNWWGSSTGPTIASNPGGTGQSIVDPDNVVDYTPFLTTQATCNNLVSQTGNLQGWAAQITSPDGVVEYTDGPATPPKGTGSLRLFTGTSGDESAQYRNSNYDGTALSSLSAMSYCTYVKQWNGSQTPYIILNVDRDNNGSVDDLLFFEPVFSNGTFNPSIPAQPNPTLNTWQCWQALRGGWYGIDASTGNPTFAGPGSNVLPFSDYVTANPSAVLRNTTRGAVRIVSGFASPTDVFDSNVDAFTVGISNTLTVYDFELSAPTANNITAGDNQGTLVNTSFPTNLQVTVTDPSSAGVPNVAVTFTAPSSGASGTFAGGCTTITIITDSSGVATAPQFTANGQAGYYTVTASVMGVNTPASFALRNMISPTAAPATISGRVTTSDGAQLGGVIVRLSGARSSITMTDASGNYSFTDVQTEGFYVVTPELANYSFSPSNRSFSLAGSRADATFVATPDAMQTANPLETEMYFVRQQYLDFLGREPDAGGLAYWTSQIAACGTDADCIRQRRIDVSAAYFMSDEFQATGSFVYRLYKASFGRVPTYSEFSSDRTHVVDAGNLEAVRTSFASEFISRPIFRQAYPDSLSNAEFVNRLCDVAGVTADRQHLINQLNSGSTRAEVLRAVIEDAGFKTREYNSSFVLMQYFGYLRRDADSGGFSFWLDVLNNRVPGSYRSMVCAFITSTEYQQRFSSVVTRFNSECGR